MVDKVTQDRKQDAQRELNLNMPDLDGLSLDNPMNAGGVNDGGGRKPSSPNKTIAIEGLKGIGSGIGAGIAAELYKAMPSLEPVVGEVTQGYQEFKDLKTELAGQLSPMMIGLEDSARKLLPRAKKFVPKALYSRIHKKLDDRYKQRQSEQYPQMTKQQLEADQITAELGQIFGTSPEEAQTQAIEQKKNELTNIALESARHKATTVQLSHVYDSLRATELFHRTIHTSYMRKSLELKYKHLFVARDTYNLLARSMATFEGYYKGLLRNTALPDMMKIQIGDYHRRNVTQKYGELMADFKGNLRKKIFEKIKSTAKSAVQHAGVFADQIGMAATASEMQQQMGDMMGEGDKNPEIGLLARGIGWGLSRLGMGSVAKHYLGKIRPVTDNIDNSLRSFKTNAYLKAAHLRRRWASGSKLERFMADFLPEMSRLEKGSNDLLTKPNDAAIFDTMTRQSIVEIIPGYLGKILHSLEKQRTGNENVSETVYDVYSRKFDTVENLKGHMAERMYGNEASRRQLYINAIGALHTGLDRNTKGLSAERQKEESDFLDEIGPDLNRFLVNHAVHAEFLDIDKLREFVNTNGKSAEYNTYIKYVTQGFKHDPIKVIRSFLRGVLKEDGSVDQHVVDSVTASMSEYRNFDSYKVELARVGETYGYRTYLSDQIGTKEKNALLKQIREGGEKGKEAAEKLKGKLGMFADNNELNMREIARMLATVNYADKDNEARVNFEREKTGRDYDNLDEGERQVREFAERSGIADAYRAARDFKDRMVGHGKRKAKAAYDWLGGVATDAGAWMDETVDKAASFIETKEGRDKFYNNLHGTFDSVKEYGGKAVDTVRQVLDNPEEAYKAAKDVVFRKATEYRNQFEESDAGKQIRDVIDNVQKKVATATDTGAEFYEEKTPESVKKFLDDAVDIAKQSPDYAKELVLRLQTAYGEHIPADVREQVNTVLKTVKDTVAEKSAEAARIVTQLMNDPEYRKQKVEETKSKTADIIEEISAATPKSKEEVVERMRTLGQKIPVPGTEDLKASADELKNVFAKALTDAINSIKDVTGAGTGTPPPSAPPELPSDGYNKNTELLSQLLNLYRDNSEQQKQDLSDWRAKLSEDHQAIFSAVNWINKTLREMPPAIASGVAMGGGPSEGPAPQYGMWGRGDAHISRMFRAGVHGAGVALNKIGKVYTNIYGAALKGAGSAIDGLGNMVGRGFDTLGRYAGAVGQNLPTILDKVGGGLKNIGKGYVSIYNTTLNGLFGTAKTIAGGLFGTKAIPYVDIYRKDEVGGAYKPILTAAMQERDPGVFFGNGKRVRNSEDITEPVFDVAGKPIIAQADIDHGLVGADNKAISTKQGSEGLISKAFGIVKGIAPGIGKGIGSIADLYKNIYTKLFGFAVDGAKGIGKLAGKFINRLFGFDVGGVSKELNANIKLMVDFMKTTNENVALIQKDVDLIARRKKKGTAAGDLDGDGDIDGTYQDQMQRKALEAKGGEAGKDGKDGKDAKKHRTWREIARDMFGRAPGDPDKEDGEGSSFFKDMMKLKAFDWLTKKLGKGRGAWKWVRKARAGAFLGKKALGRGAAAAWGGLKGLATPAGRAAASGAIHSGLSTAGSWLGAHGGHAVLSGAGHVASKLPWLGSLFGAGSATAGTTAATTAAAGGAAGTGALGALGAVATPALIAALAGYGIYRGIKGAGKEATMQNLDIGDKRDVLGEDRVYSALGLNTKWGAKGIRGLSKLSGIDALIKMFHGDENPMTEKEVKEGHDKLARKVEKGLPGYDKILQEYEKAVEAHNWPRARQLSGKEADGFWKHWAKDTLPGMAITGIGNLFFGNKDEEMTKEQIKKVHDKFSSIIKKGGAAAKNAEKLLDRFNDYVADGNWKKAREIANMENRGLLGKLFQDSKGNTSWTRALGIGLGSVLGGPLGALAGYGIGALFDKADENKPMTEAEVKSVRARLNKLSQAGNKSAQKILEQFDEAVTEMNWKKARKLCGREVMSNLAKLGGVALSTVKWTARIGTLGLSMLFETSDENPMSEKEITSFVKKMNYLINKGDKNAAKKLEKFETAVAKEDWERARAIAKMPHHSAIVRAGKAVGKWFFGNDDDEMTDAEIDKFRESMNRKIKMGNKSAERKLEAFDEAVGRGNWRKARALAQNPDEGIIQATGHVLATVGRFFFGGDGMAMSDSEIERTRKKMQNAVSDGKKNAQKRLDMFEDYVADENWKKARALAGLPYENIAARTGKNVAAWLFGGNNDKEMTSDEIDDFRNECEARIADGNKRAEKLLNQFNAAVAAENWDKARKLSKTKDSGAIGEVRKGFKSAWNWLLGNKDRKDCEEMREKIEDKALDDPTGVINAGLEQFTNLVRRRQFNKAIQLGEDILKYTPKELAKKRHFSTEEFDRLTKKAQELEANIRRAEKKNNGWVHPIKEMKLARLRRELMNNSDQWSDDYFDDLADELGTITGETDFYSQRSKPDNKTLDAGKELVERIEQQYNKRSWWKNPIVKTQLSSLKNEVKNSVMDWDDAMFDAWEERLEDIDDSYKSTRLESYEDRDEAKERKRLKKRAKKLDQLLDQTLSQYSWIGSPFVKQQLWGLRNTVKAESGLWSDKQFDRWYKELHEIDVDGEATKILAGSNNLRHADKETRARVENQRILKKYLKDNDWLSEKYTWLASPGIKSNLKADKAMAKYIISDMSPYAAKMYFKGLYDRMKEWDTDKELDESHSTMYNLEEDEIAQDRKTEINARTNAIEELNTFKVKLAQFKADVSKKPDSSKILSRISEVERKMNNWLLGMIGDATAIDLWANDPVTYPKPTADSVTKHVYSWIKELNDVDKSFYKNETLGGVDVEEYTDVVTEDEDKRDQEGIKEMRARDKAASSFITFMNAFRASYAKHGKDDSTGDIRGKYLKLGSKVNDYLEKHTNISRKALMKIVRAFTSNGVHIDKGVLAEWVSGGTMDSAKQFENKVMEFKKSLRDIDKEILVEEAAAVDSYTPEPDKPEPKKAEPTPNKPSNQTKTPEPDFEDVPEPIKYIDKKYIADLTGATMDQLTGSDGSDQSGIARPSKDTATATPTVGKDYTGVKKAPNIPAAVATSKPDDNKPVTAGIVTPDTSKTAKPASKVSTPVDATKDATSVSGKALPDIKPAPDTNKSAESKILKEIEAKAVEMAKEFKAKGAEGPGDSDCGDGNIYDYESWVREYLGGKVPTIRVKPMVQLGMTAYEKAFESASGKPEPKKDEESSFVIDKVTGVPRNRTMVEAEEVLQPKSVKPTPNTNVSIPVTSTADATQTTGKPLPKRPKPASFRGDDDEWAEHEEKFQRTLHGKDSGYEFYKGTKNATEEETFTDEGGRRKYTHKRTVNGRKIADQWFGDKLTEHQYNFLKNFIGTPMGEQFEADKDVMRAYTLAQAGEFREYTEEEKAAIAKQEADSKAAEEKRKAYAAKMEKLKDTDPKKYAAWKRQQAMLDEFEDGGVTKLAAGGLTNPKNAADYAAELIKKYEGFQSKPYICPAGKKTIGYGFTDKATLARGELTKEEADQILDAKIMEILPQIDAECPGLSNHQRGALTSFIFNLGLTSFKNSTMLKRLKEQNWDEAVKEIKRWDKATVDGKKKTLKGLTKRRAEEAKYLAQAKTDTSSMLAKADDGSKKSAKMASGGFSKKKFGIGGMLKAAGNFAGNLISSDGMGTDRGLVQILADHLDKHYGEFEKWAKTSQYGEDPFRFISEACPIDPKVLPEDFKDGEVTDDTIDAFFNEVGKRHHGQKLSFLDRLEERSKVNDLNRYQETGNSDKVSGVGDALTYAKDTAVHGLWSLFNGSTREEADAAAAKRERYAHGGFSKKFAGGGYTYAGNDRYPFGFAGKFSRMANGGFFGSIGKAFGIGGGMSSQEAFEKVEALGGWDENDKLRDVKKNYLAKWYEGDGSIPSFWAQSGQIDNDRGLMTQTLWDAISHDSKLLKEFESKGYNPIKETDKHWDTVDQAIEAGVVEGASTVSIDNSLPYKERMRLLDEMEQEAKDDKKLDEATRTEYLDNIAKARKEQERLGKARGEFASGGFAKKFAEGGFAKSEVEEYDKLVDDLNSDKDLSPEDTYKATYYEDGTKEKAFKKPTEDEVAEVYGSRDKKNYLKLLNLARHAHKIGQWAVKHPEVYDEEEKHVGGALNPLNWFAEGGLTSSDSQASADAYPPADEGAGFLTKPTTSTDADGNTILAGEAKTEAIIPLVKRPGNMLMRLGNKIKSFLSGNKPEGEVSLDTTSGTDQASVHASDPASEPMTNYLAKQLSEVIGPIGSQALYEKPSSIAEEVAPTTYGNIKNEIADKVSSTAGKIGGRTLKFIAGKAVADNPLTTYLLDKGSGEVLSGTPIGINPVGGDTSEADFFTRFSSSQNPISQANHGDKFAGTVNGAKDAFLLGTPVGRATHAIAKTVNFGSGVAKDILEQRSQFINEEFRKNHPELASYGDTALNATYTGMDWTNKISGLFKDGGFTEPAAKAQPESFEKPEPKAAETEWSPQVTSAKIATAVKADSDTSSQQMVDGISDQTAKTEEVLAELKKLVSLFSEAFKGGMIKVAGMNDLAAIMASGQQQAPAEQPPSQGLPNPSNGPSYDASRGLDLRKLIV